jgi:hypothetical protein
MGLLDVRPAFDSALEMRAQRLSPLGCFAELIFACLGSPRPPERRQANARVYLDSAAKFQSPDSVRIVTLTP